MFNLNDLYQDIIVDHNRSPRNFRKIDKANCMLEGFNPLCGDRLTLYLKMGDGKINDISFDGSGCAISVASASLMTELMKDKSIGEAQSIFEDFHQLLTDNNSKIDIQKIGKLSALAGVREYPTRIKCATLCWHTLRSALVGSEQPISTE